MENKQNYTSTVCRLCLTSRPRHLSVYFEYTFKINETFFKSNYAQ